MRRVAVAALVGLTSLLVSGVQMAAAQGNTGSVVGVVHDEQRLPIPGVSLTIRDTQTGLTRTITSRPDGTFEFSGLHPGQYRLVAELSGFQRKQAAIQLEVGQRVRLDLVLSAEGLSEVVEVTETAPLLHATDVAVGEVIDQQQVSELPLNGRQFLELSLLVPGVHQVHGAQSGSGSALYWRPGQNSAISVSGGRPNSNLYLLDGTTNTDPSFNTYVISLPPDAIREFQIQTGTYTAELGGAGTGQVNVVTKSGTADIRGSLYEYLRNSAFDARLFTSPPELPHFSQNQYGATIGGPGFARTFFFGAFEGFRSSQRQSSIMTVPLEAWRRGDFSGRPPIYDPLTATPNPAFDPTRPESPANPRVLRRQFPNNQIPLDRMNPAAFAVLNQFVPLPNLPGAINNYLDTRAQRLSTDQYNVRFDRAWSKGASVFARYSLSNESGFTPENLPGFGAFHDNRVQNLTFTAIQPVSTNFLNELRFGMIRMRLHRYGEKANGDDLVTSLGIPGVGFGGEAAYGLPRFVVQGFDPFGDSLLCTPCRYWNTTFQVGERLTWMRGHHSVKFGGDVRRFIWDMLGFFQNRGFFQFTPGFTTRTATNDGTGEALASFMLGLPVIAQRQAGLPSMNMRQSAFDLFVQDDWRVSQSLTLNLGLRYEMSTPLTDTRKVLTNLTWVDGQPYAYVGGQLGFPTGLAFTDRNNVAPRLGVAYAPGEGQYVVRAGYGGFYSYPDMNLWCNQVHNVPLVFPEIQQSNNFVPSITGFGFAPPVLGQTLVAFTALDPHARTPYVQQASLTIERQIGRDMMVQAGYLGAWARNLDRARLVNNAPPGPAALATRRPYRTLTFLPGTELPPDLDVDVLSLTFPVGPINLLENTARSSYNSGWVLAKRKLSKGLSFLTSYTWTKNLTDAPAFRSPGMESEVPQDSFNLDAEWGPSGHDTRHRVVGSLIYQIPFSASAASGGASRWVRYLLGDWQIASIFQFHSGHPFTIGVFGDTANAGSLLNINPVRANAVPGASPALPESERTTDRWFNTAAFSAPPAFMFGNAGRNSMVGPGMKKVDVALDRQFRLKGDTTLAFRVEAFNVFNFTNLGTPQRFVNTPQFGSITEAATPARQIQFVVRAAF